MTQTVLQKLTRTKPIERMADADEKTSSGGLGRSLGLFSLTMIGVGATIGTGIFFTMVEAVPKAGPAVIVSFLIAAAITGLTALCYAELAARIQASGSSYSFAYATVGEFAAFIVAACLLLEYGLAASATAIGWSAYLNNFLENALHWQIPHDLRAPMIVSGEHGVELHTGQFNLPPVMLVCLCGIILTRGTKEAASMNATMVLIKLAILAFFVVVALRGFAAKNFVPFVNTDNSKGFAGMVGITAAAGTVFFSFIGLDAIACGGEEVRNPKRNVPIGIMAALVIVTVFYLFVAVAALGAQPASKFAGQEAGLSVILQTVTGRPWLAIVLSAGAVISVFSVMLATIYGQTRILFAISRDGLVPKVFQKVNERTLTPVRNTVIVCVAVGLAAGLVDSEFLWDVVSMGTLTAFVVVSIAVPVLRYKQRAAPQSGFRPPFGPYLVPALSVAAFLYIMKDLSLTTMHIFTIWMSCAILIYLFYGLPNSRLNRTAT